MIKTKKRYEYFVSYNYATRQQGVGFGNGFYDMDKKIKGWSDLDKVAKFIKQELKEKAQIYVDGPIVILNYQLTK